MQFEFERGLPHFRDTSALSFSLGKEVGCLVIKAFHDKHDDIAEDDDDDDDIVEDGDDDDDDDDATAGAYDFDAWAGARQFHDDDCDELNDHYVI